MKFIAGLRVWGNWKIGENVLKVFLRLRGSANRRVDLFLPLIASIPRGRGRGIEALAMPEAGTQRCSAHRIWELGVGIMPEAGTHAARNGIGGPGN